MQEQFRAACSAPAGSPHRPWDLLIVDACHNLMPSPFGEDSELCRMLRMVAPQFEHRLFLSATPHNGHTRSFTGLLEMLDPVRFTCALLVKIRTRLLGPIFADPTLAPKPRSKNPSTVEAALRTVDRALDTLCSTLALSTAAA